MSFFNGNCCLKLNYFICGSKYFSSKKKKFNSKTKTFVNNVQSPRRTLSQQYPNYFKQPYSEEYVYRFDKANLTRRDSDYDSSLNNSIDYKLSKQFVVKNIQLHRNSLNEQLGLTLTYDYKSKSLTNIYIQKIDRRSLCYYSGEVKIGDQIIKINNRRVKNRHQLIQVIQQNLIINLQILRFKNLKRRLSINGSAEVTDYDSGIIVPSNNDFQINNKKCSISSSCLFLNKVEKNFNFKENVNPRRCLSLNDLRKNVYFEEDLHLLNNSIHSKSLFEIETDDEDLFVKPLPFNWSKSRTDSGLVLEQFYLNKQINHSNNFRQKKFKRRKKKSNLKLIKENSIKSITEDFSLLNRIFLRENQNELNSKPYLAKKFEEELFIQKEKLKQISPFIHQQFIQSKSTTNKSIDTNFYHPSTIFI